MAEIIKVSRIFTLDETLDRHDNPARVCAWDRNWAEFEGFCVDARFQIIGCYGVLALDMPFPKIKDSGPARRAPAPVLFSAFKQTPDGLTGYAYSDIAQCSGLELQLPSDSVLYSEAVWEWLLVGSEEKDNRPQQKEAAK
jgi:hypothetical protein